MNNRMLYYYYWNVFFQTIEHNLFNILHKKFWLDFLIFFFLLRYPDSSKVFNKCQDQDILYQICLTYVIFILNFI